MQNMDMRTVSFRRMIVAALLFAVAASTSTLYAQKRSADYGVFKHAGAEIGFGTEGFRLSLGTTITPFFELGVGLNYMPAFTLSGNMKFRNTTVNIPTASGDMNTYYLNTVKVEGKLDRLTFDANLYVYPFGPGTIFFVGAGVSVGGGRVAKLSGHSDEAARIYNENRDYFDSGLVQYESMVEAVVGKTALSFAKTGDIIGEVRTKKVRPYVGAGIGRLVAKGGMGMRLEAGVQFTGKLKLYQGDEEIPYDDILERADNQLAKLIDRMNFYPVIRLTLTGRLM